MNFNSIKPMLCPPGNGVYTVHTASEYKASLHNFLYNTTIPEEVLTKWQNSLHQKIDRPILFGICSDSGGGIQRGANWGPLFIRNKLVEYNTLNKLFDLGDIKIIPHLLHDKYLNEKTIKECREALYGGAELPVSPLSIAEQVTDVIASHHSFIALGGDHSVSYPLVKSWIQARRRAGKRVAIIHFDAHTDLLQKRLGIDLCFGSWAYHIIDELDSPEHLIQLGIRSSGKDRNHWENKFGIQQYWSHEIQSKGINAISTEINNFLKTSKIDEIYISFDIDAIDSHYASATGTPEKQGLLPHEAIGLIKNISSGIKVHSADLVEVAPFVNSTKQENSQSTTLETCYSIMEAMMSEII
jgi:agmatinase